MFPLAQRYVDRVVLVADEAIRAAQRALWRVLRVVAEPGGAAAFAALLSGATSRRRRARRRAALRRQHRRGGFRPHLALSAEVDAGSASKMRPAL